jgi:hypothetical protein
MEADLGGAMMDESVSTANISPIVQNTESSVPEFLTCPDSVIIYGQRAF